MLSTQLRVVAGTVAVAAALLASSVQAHAAPWYWSPGVCKSQLKADGVDVDGRTFRVQSVYCIGQGGYSTCMWNDSYSRRLYRTFIVFTRSYDGSVRKFTLHPNGKRGWQGGATKLYGRMSSYAFNRLVAPIAEIAAHRGHELGCADAS